MTREAEPGPATSTGDAPPRARAGGLLGLLRRVGVLLQRVPRRNAWLPIGLWAGLIWISSASRFPAVAPGRSLGWFANLAHAPLFGILALWAALAAPRRDGWPRLEGAAALAILGAVAAYGLVDELHQAGVSGRDFSLFDLVTDVTGAACVLWIARYVARAGADGRGLGRRLLAGLALCALAASLATWGPVAFPGVGWM